LDINDPNSKYKKKSKENDKLKSLKKYIEESYGKNFDME